MDMKSQSICWPQKNCLVAFFHVSLPLLISCPCITLKLPLAFPVAVLQVCLANLKARLSFFPFFSFFCCATFLNAAFSIRQRLISAFLFMQQKEVPGQPAGPSSYRCSTLLRTPPAIVVQRLFHKAGVVRLPLLSRALHPRVEKLVPDTHCFHGRLRCNMLQIYSLSVNFVVFLLLFY